MKKGKKVISIIIFLVAFVIIPFNVGASLKWYIYHVLNVWSVDSGKHLDWSGTMNYMQNFYNGINVWNNYKNGVIRKDTLLTINDITIKSVNDISGNTVAVTIQTGSGKSSSSRIEFSTSKMSNLTDNQRNIACTHELGHALGLDENNNSGKNVIMYNNLSDNSSNNVLHNEDKINYDYMYNNKY